MKSSAPDLIFRDTAMPSSTWEQIRFTSHHRGSLAIQPDGTSLINFQQNRTQRGYRTRNADNSYDSCISLARTVLAWKNNIIIIVKDSHKMINWRQCVCNPRYPINYWTFSFPRLPYLIDIDWRHSHMPVVSLGYSILKGTKHSLNLMNSSVMEREEGKKM